MSGCYNEKRQDERSAVEYPRDHPRHTHSFFLTALIVVIVENIIRDDSLKVQQKELSTRIASIHFFAHSQKGGFVFSTLRK